MDSIKRVTISWSGGKDAAFALYKILQSKQYEVVHLHTVVDADTHRIGMHGVRETLLRQQAQALSLPLRILYLEKSENNAKYEQLVTAFYKSCADEGVEAVVFGDIFIEDLRSYRDALLKTSGLEGIYPLWKLNTTELIKDFVNTGFKAVLCSASAEFFSEGEVGQTIDQDFCKRISPGIDLCGERGEFHTFVYDGPLFDKPVKAQKERVIQQHYQFDTRDEDGSVRRVKSDFWFQELLPLMAL